MLHSTRLGRRVLAVVALALVLGWSAPADTATTTQADPYWCC